LEFKEIFGPHTGENLAEIVGDTLKNFKLGKKLLSVTADNAKNNETMMEELEGILEFQGQFTGMSSYVRCIAHILNLIAKEILSHLGLGSYKEVEDLCDRVNSGLDITSISTLAKIRTLALWVQRSPQRRESWKMICQMKDLNDSLIRYDVETRWNSTYRMLSDAIEKRRKIEEYIKIQSDFTAFSSLDWDYLSELLKVLKPFDEITRYVSQNAPTIASALGIYYELYDMLHDASEQEGLYQNISTEIASAVSKALKKYEKYYTYMDSNDIYYIASILDPRVKGKIIEKELGADGTKIIEAMTTKLKQQFGTSIIEQQVDVPTHGLESKLLSKMGSLKRESDIDRYLRQDTVYHNGTGRDWLCKWWQNHRADYPGMASAARWYLAIPASEVAVERVFSQGRDLIGVRRHSLSGETMRMVMLTRETA
jgi:hypothetical protein